MDFLFFFNVNSLWQKLWQMCFQHCLCVQKLLLLICYYLNLQFWFWYFLLFSCIISMAPSPWGPWLIWCIGTGRQQTIAYVYTEKVRPLFYWIFLSLPRCLLWLSRNSRSLGTLPFSVIKLKSHCLSALCYSTKFCLYFFPKTNCFFLYLSYRETVKIII